jgi:hypothetical protein
MNDNQPRIYTIVPRVGIRVALREEYGYTNSGLNLFLYLRDAARATYSYFA